MTNSKLYLAGRKPLKYDQTLVMGILNATPDSFSDGGELIEETVLRERIKSMIDSGADILDVGGESTRPGHEEIGPSEELRRILPVIEAIRAISKTIPISIDTQKAAVADQALEAGASMINDVSALSDKKMASVASKHKCSIILMRGKSTGRDVIAGCKRQFEEILAKAKKQGLDKSQILLDPGLGFGDLAGGDYSSPPGSGAKDNLMLIISIKKYSLGLPVVIGASRKRFIGELTNVKQPKERIVGSVAAAVMANRSGAHIVRVHDVAETVQAFKLLSF